MRFTQHSAQIYGTLCICAFIFSSCSNAKYLSKDEYYYKGTTVEITDTLDLPPTLQNLSTDLRRLSKIEPNKKLFGIYPLKLWLYNIGDTGIDMYVRNRAELDKKFLFFDFEKVINNLNVLEPQSKFRRWLKEKAGEPQSLMDTILVEETKIRMENYLYNRGFFYPEVTYTVEYQEKKRMAIVTYLAEVNTLYRMGKITYEIEEPRLKKIVTEIPDTSYLQPGNPFDVDYIKYERNRITIYLLNNGYYNFEKDFVYFEVDSSSGKDSLDVYVKISNPKGDSLHHRYRINNIYVYPDAQRDFDKSSVDLDTTHYRDDKSDYYFISSHLEYKPGALASNIFINDSSVIIRNDSIIYQPRYYSISNTRQTVGAFSNLGIFKFVTIEHQELDSGAYFRYLDVIIQLEPLPRKQLTTEFNTSLTTDNLLGNFLNVSYAQKNLLRRLDQVRFNVSGGIESSITGDNVGINTSELSASVNLIMPKFFWPFNMNVPKRYFPKTITSLKSQYLTRIDLYTLFSSSFEYGAQWFVNSKAQEFNVNLIDISLITVPYKSDSFNTILEENLLLLQSFEEQLIFGPNFTWIYNSQIKRDKRNDIYFRATAEVDGSLMYAFQSGFSGPSFLKKVNDTTPYQIAGFPYSTMSKIDLDFRNYFDMNSANKLAGRATFGIAIPYWNSEVVPYVKQFFAGGTNDIRAFPIRQLGPGSYFPYTEIVDSLATARAGDQTGDIKLQMNFEYRFDIFSIFEGALFCDIGNIWTLKQDDFRPGSQLKFDSNFINQIAVGPGAGIRLDLSFFILRLDAAYPLWDPALDGPYGQAYKDLYQELGVVFPDKQITWNLAIGYPF